MMGLPVGIDLAGADWQRPRVVWAPGIAVSSAGCEAIELARHAGLMLDVWQQYALAVMLLERSDGRWACPEMGIVVSRQNGKGGILEARELAGLFLFGERTLVHSAHLFDTAQAHMRRMVNLIDGVPEFSRRIKQVHQSKGQERIELNSGAELKFKTRTPTGGRGLSGEFVAIDEAMIVPESVIGALMPTLTAFENQQMVYSGSAVNQSVHPHGMAFARLRERGIAKDDRVGWLSWTVDPDEYNRRPTEVASDRAAWRQANPALGIRVSEEWLESERRQMDPQTFAAEVLGVGDWPAVDEGSNRLIPQAYIDRVADPISGLDGKYVLAVDTTPERSYSTIAAAGPRSIGGIHAEVTGDKELDHQPGTRWVPGRLREIIDRNPGCCAVVIDKLSPAASLEPDLAAVGIHAPMRGREPDEDHLLAITDTQFMLDACSWVYDELTDGESVKIAHPGQHVLNTAFANAKKRNVGDRWALARRAAGDISPAVAWTLALHGARVYAGDDAVPFFL